MYLHTALFDLVSVNNNFPNNNLPKSYIQNYKIKVLEMRNNESEINAQSYF